jgi:hypothetical protein
MKKFAFLAIVIAFVFALSVPSARAAVRLSGQWKGLGKSMVYGDTSAWPGSLTQDGRRLSGTFKITNTIAGTVSLKVAGTVARSGVINLKARYRYQGETYTFWFQCWSYANKFIAGAWYMTDSWGYLEDGGSFKLTKQILRQGILQPEESDLEDEY